MRIYEMLKLFHYCWWFTIWNTMESLIIQLRTFCVGDWRDSWSCLRKYPMKSWMILRQNAFILAATSVNLFAGQNARNVRNDTKNWMGTSMSVPPNSQSHSWKNHKLQSAWMTFIQWQTFERLKKQWHIIKIQASEQQTTNLKLNQLPIIYYLLKIDFYLFQIWVNYFTNLKSF